VFRAGAGAGAGSDTGAGAGPGTRIGAGSVSNIPASSVSVLPDSDGGVSASGVSVTPVALVSVTVALKYLLLSRLSFPIPRSGVKSDLTTPRQQQMISNAVTALNRNLLARYSSPIFILFLWYGRGMNEVYCRFTSTSKV
jgi:hypothetical protein